MINKTRCLFYEVGGQFFKDLEEAQAADLKKLLPGDFLTDGTMDFGEKLAGWLISNKEAIVDCLTTTPKSRLRGRKSHGATRKPRAAKNAMTGTTPTP